MKIVGWLTSLHQHTESSGKLEDRSLSQRQNTGRPRRQLGRRLLQAIYTGTACLNSQRGVQRTTG